MNDPSASRDVEHQGVEDTSGNVLGRFRAAFETAGIGMCLATPDGTVLDANPALCEMLGYSREELKSRDSASVTHPEDLGISQDCVRCLLSGERHVYRFEKRYVHKDGGIVWADVSSTLLEDASVKPQYFITQVQDVTGRKRVEVELRKTQQLLSSLLEHAPTPIYATELDSTYRFVNPAWQRSTRISQEDAVGRTVADLFGALMAEQYEEENRPVLESGIPVAFEESATTAGVDHCFHTVRFPIPNNEGGVEGVGAISVDIMDRKRVEAALRESEERFRTAYERSAVGMTLTGVDGSLIDGNEAFCGMVGYQRGELPSHSILELTHDDDVEATRDLGRRLLSGESDVEHLEKRYVRRDGEAVWADVSVFLVHNADGSPRHFITHQRDVTGRREVDAALRDSEERFRRAFEAAPTGISLTAVDGTLKKVNRALCNILGRTEQELVGGNMASVTHPDDVEMTRHWMMHLVESGERACQFEKRFVHGDGHLVFAEVNSFLLRDTEGRPLHFISHIIDVTERRAAASALQDSERRFREMTDLLPDMIVELDLGLRATYINRAVTQVLGYTETDVEHGLGMADVLDDETLNRATADISDALAGGEPVQRVYDLVCKDGRIIPVEVHATGIHNSDGELTGFRGVLRDITERRKVEDSQRLAALGQLAAGVSHEYNNLMAVLMLQAELAAEDRTVERYELLVGTALRVAAHGGDVARGLTAFARPDSPSREPLHVEAVIDAALALCANQIENCGVVVTRDYRTDGRHMSADGRQLEQVFVNLFVNACHAMPWGGTLAVETRHVPRTGGVGDIVVTITDTGIGIEREHLPRIFEPFFTTKGRLSGSDVAGSGLGLSVSHGIMKAHGGEIMAHSEVGMGTTLELVLPAYAPLAPMQSLGDAGEVLTSTSPATAGRATRILVAEDGEDLSASIRAILIADGHEVDCVHTAGDAISALQMYRYDLVITDLLMPGGGGRAVLAFAGSVGEPPPVLIITGVVEAQVGEEMLAMGAARVLDKPFSQLALTQAVDSLFAGESE